MAARKRRKPVVYYRGWVAPAGIAPLGYWEVGDKVTIPPRPPKFGDEGEPGFEGEVFRVDPDGMAMVRPVPEEDDDGGS